MFWCDHIREMSHPWSGLYLEYKKKNGITEEFFVDDEWKACPICGKERPNEFTDLQMS